MWKLELSRSLRIGSTSLLVPALLLMVLGLRPDAADAASFLFSFPLNTSTTDDGSWYKVAGAEGTLQQAYDVGTALTLELPTTDETLSTLQSGKASITNFSLPASVDSLGIFFQFTSVNTVINGNVWVNGGQVSISFPDISVGFERAERRPPPPLNTSELYPGTFTLTLTTGNAIIPDGCAGRGGDQVISGLPLDLTTGALRLVAAVCPYYVDKGELNLFKYDEAIILALRGNVAVTGVPEPRTAALLGGGLVALLALARRKSAS